jgi:hypothetical protein
LAFETARLRNPSTSVFFVFVGAIARPSFRPLGALQFPRALLGGNWSSNNGSSNQIFTGVGNQNSKTGGASIDDKIV